MWVRGGLDVALAEDHGACVRAVDVAEEGRGAVARGGALADIRPAVVAVVGGHFGGVLAMVRGGFAGGGFLSSAGLVFGGDAPGSPSCYKINESRASVG